MVLVCFSEGEVMQVPLEMSFREMPPNEQLETEIRDRVAKLEEFYDRITSCHVIVEASRRHQTGNLYQVRIHLAVPGRELVVDRQPGDIHAHTDVNVAIRDAFKAVRRQLQDYVRELRGQTKHHDEPAHGVVTKLMEHDGYGFIQTPDQRTVYFHFNSLLTDPKELVIGSQVRFVEETGDEGPQATSVRVVGRHHQFAH